MMARGKGSRKGNSQEPMGGMGSARESLLPPEIAHDRGGSKKHEEEKLICG